jgi:hypothetical protein
MAGNFKESAFLAYQAFRELANHEMNLATSLQSLVPTNKGSSSMSAQYLHEDAVMLKDLSEQLKALMLAYNPRSSSQSPPR